MLPRAVYWMSGMPRLAASVASVMLPLMPKRATPSMSPASSPQSSSALTVAAPRLLDRPDAHGREHLRCLAPGAPLEDQLSLGDAVEVAEGHSRGKRRAGLRTKNSSA